MDTAFKSFFLICIIILAVLTFLCLIRTIKGPRLVDRIVGTNMIGTMTIAIIALLAAYLNESSILDICLIYAIMSFVAVIVLTKIYIGIYNEKKSAQHKKEERVRMSISPVRFIIAAILIMTGILIMVIQTFGVFRLKYALNRMHAAAMGDSLGIMMIILGMMVIYGFSFASLKLLTVLVVFWFASPVCSHLLAKLEVSTNEQIEEECEVPEE